jgi:hypothetical protein
MKGMNGGKKKDNDFRDAFVRRELNRDLGILNSERPFRPYAAPHGAVAPGMVDFDVGSAMLRQQQIEIARNDQSLNLRAMALLSQEQQQQQQQLQQFRIDSMLAGALPTPNRDPLLIELAQRDQTMRLQQLLALQQQQQRQQRQQQGGQDQLGGGYPNGPF